MINLRLHGTIWYCLREERYKWLSCYTFPSVSRVIFERWHLYLIPQQNCCEIFYVQIKPLVLNLLPKIFLEVLSSCFGLCILSVSFCVSLLPFHSSSLSPCLSFHPFILSFFSQEVLLNLPWMFILSPGAWLSSRDLDLPCFLLSVGAFGKSAGEVNNQLRKSHNSWGWHGRNTPIS